MKWDVWQCRNCGVGGATACLGGPTTLNLFSTVNDILANINNGRTQFVSPAEMAATEHATSSGHMVDIKTVISQIPPTYNNW
jgi:hypothetical protein